MIDNERYIFNKVATALRKEYDVIYITDTEITDTPPKFPAVSVIMTNNTVTSGYVTFGKLEIVVNEEYKIEIFSNLSDGYGRDEIKGILETVNAVMTDENAFRTFSEPIFNADPSISRRIARYRITQTKQEE